MHPIIQFLFTEYKSWFLKFCNKNSVALVRKRTIPTERPPPVGEVVPTFAGRGVSRGQRNEFPRPFSVF